MGEARTRMVQMGKVRSQGHPTAQGTLNPGRLAPEVRLGRLWWPGQPPSPGPTASV